MNNQDMSNPYKPPITQPDEHPNSAKKTGSSVLFWRPFLTSGGVVFGSFFFLQIIGPKIAFFSGNNNPFELLLYFIVCMTAIVALVVVVWIRLAGKSYTRSFAEGCLVILLMPMWLIAGFTALRIIAGRYS